MARIFPHPDLENYFVEFDMSRSNGADEVGRHYEAGKVIVLKNFRLDYDAHLLASVDFPETADFKKLRTDTVLEPDGGRSRGWRTVARSMLGWPRDPARAELFARTFSKNRRQMNSFLAQMEHIDLQVRQLTSRFFPSYRISDDRMTWRFQETINENLHVDVYREDMPDHMLRLFVNLDVVPRIWHTSYTLEHLLQNYLPKLDRTFVSSATPGRICHTLNFAVFKSFPEAGREGCPKHIIFFDPGEVWLVDSRKVSHQIFFGRKALSTDYLVDRASMLDPSTHYYALVEAYRSPQRQGTVT